VAYKKLYFCEIGSLMLFWAYKKQFLSQDWLNESTMKLLIIAMFLGLGYGVQNVIRKYQQSENAK
jgi:type IV secretory pathway TrbL component